MDFTLRQLAYFEAAASAGSLTRAAEQCRVTPSALTLAIDELERHLGVQLLIRRKARGVTLTATGTMLLTQARALLGQAKAMADQALVATTSLSGRFAIGCFTTLTPFFAPRIVSFFRSNHPHVDVSVTSEDSAAIDEQLLQGRLDVALMYSVDVPASLSFEPVLDYRPHVIVSSSHPLAQHGTVSLRDLVDTPLIDLDVTPTRQNTHQIFTDLGLTPRIGEVSTSYEAVRCLVGAGLGYAVLFQRPAITHTYDGAEVRVLELSDPVRHAIVGLSQPHGAPVTARYAALREELRRTRPTGGEAA